MIKIIRQNYKKNTDLFNKTKNEFLNILKENIFIEHIGSTAIPKMSGKNIIDILIGVKDPSNIEKIALQIEEMKFYRGRNNHSGNYIFFASRQEETKSGDIHLHLVVENSDRFNDFLAVKNYLLSNPLAVKEYTHLKHKLAKQSFKNREQYKLLKSEYMNNMLSKSREYMRTKE